MSARSLSERLRGIVKPASALLGAAGHPPPPAKPPLDPADSSAPRDGGQDAVSGGADLDVATDGLTVDHRLHRTLGGGWRCDESGRTRCYVVEQRLAPEHRHGRTEIGTLAESLRGSAADAPLLAHGAPARGPFLFFDLETTGLSGGAGTYAFLVGCAWFDDDGAFVTRQYVLTTVAHERTMLEHVSRELNAAGALVSFNGRSFDAPLLESRCLYHRLPWTPGRLPHVDMLHPARRFWRQDTAGIQSSCSLGTLERQLLDAPRVNDIPGVEAPARYFQFIRSGDPRPLAGVLQHNRTDLLSLAALTVRLLRLINEGAEAAATMQEAVALGRLFERAGLPGRAAEAFERAMRFPLPGRGALSGLDAAALPAEALRSLAQMARRARRHDAAAAWWRQALELPGCPPAIAREAAEALAIHHEHRTRDLEAARRFALRIVENTPGTSPPHQVSYRMARIDRKRAAAMQRPPLPDFLDEISF